MLLNHLSQIERIPYEKATDDLGSDAVMPQFH